MNTGLDSPSGNILITRTARDCQELKALLAGSRISLRPFPVLRLAEHTDRKGWKKVTKLLDEGATSFPWLVLTSPRAARFLVEQAGERGTSRVLSLATAAIGAATAQAAEEAGFQVQVVGQGGGTELARELTGLWPGTTTAILAAGVHARPELPSALEAAGHRVIKLEVYEMKATPALELPPVGPADAIVLTSPRAAQLYLEAVGGLPLPLVHWALGPTTRDAAHAMGIKDCRIPASPSMEDLAEALREYHGSTSF